MRKVEEQKIKLEQKKNRLIAEETRLKLKERKMRTHHLIEVGGLITKAKLDHLPTNTLYGALLSLADSLKANDSIKNEWTKLGKLRLDQEQQSRKAIILKFEEQPDNDIRKSIRNYGLRWNKYRNEWYGNATDLAALKNDIASLKYTIEEISNGEL